MSKNTLLLFGFAALLILLFGCCNFFNPNANEIKNQDAIVASNLSAAEKLLDFQEQAKLSAFEPKYQNYSNNIAAACVRLDVIDKDMTVRAKQTKLVCESKAGLDKCFFQLEKIKVQLKNNDTNVNLDSLDVLCSDLRSMNLQTNLDAFKSQYVNYTGWLKAEQGILADWNMITALFSNTSSSEHLSGAKLSDYYVEYKNQMDGAKTSLQDIKSKCALKNEYKITDAKVEKICNNVDDYLSDVDKANAVVLETFDFFSSFETGTTVINAVFIRDCNQESKNFEALYDLELLKDATLNQTNATTFESLCTEIEDLSTIYGNLGIPLSFENGQLSSNTRIELLKAKTTFVETDEALGSGVIVSSDESGYYILTNAHVALSYDAYTDTKYLPYYVRVKFYDGKMGYATQLAYTQEGYDFVLLYVPSSGSYPIASYYADYYPNAGDKVVAVGNPYGLEFSTSQGTVSGTRDLGCFTDYCYGYVIQTDAAVNPGNSGGGLWDYESGDLLGITSLGLTQAEGLNFAISMYQYEKIKDTFKWYSID